MRKFLIIFLVAFIVTACSNNQSNQEKVLENTDIDRQEEKIKEAEEEDNSSEEAVEEELQAPNQESHENLSSEDSSVDEKELSTINNDQLKNYEEYEVLKRELNLDTHKGVLKTDNKGNRIIIFETESGKKEYKSIFIKHKNRLKIVQFDNENNLLFNDRI